MWVNGPTRLSSVNAKAPARRKSGGNGGFSVGMADDQPARASSGTSPAASVPGIEALIALQGVEDPLTGRKKAVRRGLDILDILEEMKLDLLSGRISPERLARLAAIIDRHQDSGDPEINAVIAEIELRALVELAKLGR